MKNIVFTAILGSSLLLSCSKPALPANAENNNTAVTAGRAVNDLIQPAYTVPGVVLTSFNSLFPNAVRPVWQYLNRVTWQVNFFSGDEYWMALFKSDGSFISASML
ncbi:MAG: hypothetical protein HZA79_01050 [Sphingobacteriales bacterium]|nr:hypothetical protein [Sphingobacteriales bacterium]